MNKKAMLEFISSLMKKMTIDEKIGQLFETSYQGGYITGPEFENNDTIQLLKKGLVGSIIGLYDNKEIMKLQQVAVEKTRCHIPLFFANDIIHGCRTILPIPLAMACSWNLDLIKDAIKVSTKESFASGVNVVFSPVADLAKDARWGRVMEGNGEDPYLSGQIVKTYVEAIQQKAKDGYNMLAACLKHYIAYGAVEAGRDYNTVDMSLDQLYNYYLPPFIEGVKAKAQMVMTSFNTFNGVPLACNKFLIKDVLRKKLKFKGVVISDYTGTEEIIKHKVATTKDEVALKCLDAGIDHEMIARCYLENLAKHKDDPKIIKAIDDACYNVLKLKYELGLFKDPYRAIHLDFMDRWFKVDDKKVALKMANESICLLENKILPFKRSDKVLFIGPFIDNKNILGAWSGKGERCDTETILEILKKENYNFDYFKGSNIFDELNVAGLDEKIKAADKIVLILGEDEWMSGECHSRVNLDLPKVQDELFDYVVKFNKPTALMIHAGRPLVLTKYKKAYDEGKISALVYLWFLGTMSAKALIDTIYGKNVPSGKITMSFPYSVGQLPLYYNHLPTGRPKEEGKPDDYLTRYIDCPNDALYPFGYGLSYTKFKYQNLKLENDLLKDELKFTIEIINESNLKAKEIVQVYIECLCDTVSRPVAELKAFKKLSFLPHEKKVVEFSLKRNALSYYYQGKKYVAQGKYALKVGPNSMDTITCYFEVDKLCK